MKKISREVGRLTICPNDLSRAESIRLGPAFTALGDEVGRRTVVAGRAQPHVASRAATLGKGRVRARGGAKAAPCGKNQTMDHRPNKHGCRNK